MKTKKIEKESDLSRTVNTKYCYEILDVVENDFFNLYFFLGDKWHLGQK